MSISYLLYKNNELYGVYDDTLKYEKLITNDDDYKIIMYRMNTNHIIGEYSINHLKKSKKETKTNNEKEINNEEEKKETEEELKKINEQRVFDNNVKNIRKKQKKLIEESKTKYENNLKLYNEFKDRLINDSSFSIPEPFIDIYNIMNKLDQDDKLDWDNYSLLYREIDMHGRNKTIHDVLDEFDQTIKFMKINN